MGLRCGSDNSTGQVAFLARMISLDGVNSTELLPQLQRWTQTGPTITVKGVSLTISADCSVHLRDFSRPACIRLTAPTSATPTTYGPTTVDQAEPSAASWPVIPVTAGLGGGMLLLIMIIIVLLAIVLVLKKRQSKQSYPVNRYGTCHTDT